MQPYSLPHKQQGAVLLIGMIMLVILMLGATSLMNGTVMDERLAGNSKASAEAFFAAEAGYITAVSHLKPKKADEPTEIDTAKANKHWAELHDEIKKYETTAQWNNRPKDPEIPSALKSAGSTRAFEVIIEPVFETKEDANGNKITKRVDGRIKFVSKGKFFAKGGEQLLATRTIGFDLEVGGGGSPLPPAPAAISCFGGNCLVRAGAANKAPISGLDHPMPNPSCGGNNCRTEPNHNSEHNVPAVYLSNFDDVNSQVGVQGNNGNSKKVSFEGADRDSAHKENFYQFSADSGKTKGENGSIWGPEHYNNSPKDTPLDSDYAGPNAAKLKDIYTAAESASSDFSGPLNVINTNSFDGEFPISGNHEGVVIIEGKGPNNTSNVLSTDQGNGYFAGLIILKDCNSLSFKGTPYVFGAIIVDATGCSDDYSPFVGTGNPEVLYSKDALDKASNSVGAGVNGLKVDWYEIVNND